MSKAVLSVIVGFLFCSVSYSQGEWKEFRSEQHKFKVNFPGKIQEVKEANSSDAGGYSYDFKCMLREPKWLFAVKVYDDLAAHSNPTDEQLRIRLDRSRDSVLSGMAESKLLSERDITVSNRLAREFAVENRSFLVRARVHYSNNHLYLVTAMMKKSQSNGEKFDETAAQFMESFAILP